jgi:hypothetical protein
MTPPIAEIIGVNFRWVPGCASLANDAERGKEKYSQKLTCPTVTLSTASPSRGERHVTASCSQMVFSFHALM